MPTGMPFTVFELFARFIRSTGFTKLSTTTFTAGTPSPRSINQ